MLLQVEAAAQDIEVRSFYCPFSHRLLRGVSHSFPKFSVPDIYADFDPSLQIISQFESSTATLKTILSHPSLQRATIDATMDAMADANVEARSIDDAIRNGIEMSQADGVAEIDDEEIQKELENLVDEAQREERAQKDVSVYETDNAQRQGQPEVERSEEEARKLESPALEDVDTNGGLLTESNRNIDQMPDAPTRPLESSVEAESKRLSSKVQIESI